MVSTNPIYRNKRKNYYQETGPDSVAVGTIINVFKTKSSKNSFDSSFIPTNIPVNGITAYTNISGNSQPENNPDYQYIGYLYCDGSEYNIKDYPLLYSIIGNLYGGTAGSGISQSNVFENWPSENMGTFKVPDLLAKKIVGYGPVYGSGSPSIGNIEMVVGPSSIAGFWYLSKDTQKGYFNLGKIRTTGYSDVIGTTTGRIQGSQTITVTLVDNDLNGPAQHTHLLLHSEAPNVQGFPVGSSVDPYLSGYRNKNGRILSFSPSGGTKLTHSHALSKKRLSGSNTATYDKFNWSGGDTGPGSIKSNGSYWASGNSGEFQDITYTPNPTFKIFTNSSQIGGLDIVTDGTPVYEDTEYEYVSPGTSTLSLPTSTDKILVEMYGGSGSGGSWKTSGNAGTASSVQLGDGTALTITAGGGQPGGAVQENTSILPYTETAGVGGTGGTNAITGTYSTNTYFNVTTDFSGSNPFLQGQAGGSGKFWIGDWTSPPTDTFGNKTWEGFGYGGGSNGKFLTVSSFANGTVVDVSYPNTGTFNIITTDSRYKIQSATIELWGARGANAGNLICATGLGGPGKYFKISKKALAGTDGIVSISGTYQFYPGQSGVPAFGNANVTSGSTGLGGSGGDGYSNNDGGGGGAATFVAGIVGGGASTIVAGAGAGGGGGGYGEGQCGDNAIGSSIIDTVQGTTQPLFGGGGGAGGNYGCTGGGGGGGGGGIGLASQTGTPQGSTEGGGTAYAGGPGGGGGGTGGHGGGYGGSRGISSYNSDLFDSPVAQGNSDQTEGRIRGEVVENRSNWTSGAGGGGGGGRITGEITKDALTVSNATSLTVAIGTGGAGVSSSFSRTLNGSIGWTEISNTETSFAGNNGYAKLTLRRLVSVFGGTLTTTVGDIVVKASPGITTVSSDGSGIGTAGGFKLPVNQVPVIQIEAQGDQPGFGATATATVAGSVVSNITLNNPGSGYTSAPKIRFLHGCGGGTISTTSINSAGQVDQVSLQLGSSQAYTRYVKFGGQQLERYIVLTSQDCTNVEKFGVKCARGNNINGGERPDDSGDQLLLYYNTDGTLNFPDTNFVGVLVPRPSDDEIANNYDGTGTGLNPTNWYSYFLDLPSGARTTGVRFKIIQKRTAVNATNDNGGNTDQYGICEFLYDYAFISETVLVNTPGEITGNSRTLTYTIEGSARSLYSLGADVNDITFTLGSGTPLTPTPALDPVKNIPLLEPYALTKYLIKAF